MANNGVTEVRPKTDQDALRIAAGSPLAIQGIFLEILRERFAPNNGLEWGWDENPTETEILIETSYNEEIESRNQAPAIYVTRLASVPRKLNIGDRAGVRLKDSLEGFHARMEIQMQLDCVSTDEGESAIIGDIVQFTILASQDVLEREFGFHDFEHPILGQTTPFDRDRTKWVSPVSFNLGFEIRWSQVPIAPLLKQLSLRIEQSGTDFFKEVVLTSMRRAELGDCGG